MTCIIRFFYNQSKKKVREYFDYIHTKIYQEIAEILQAFFLKNRDLYIFFVVYVQ